MASERSGPQICEPTISGPQILSFITSLGESLFSVFFPSDCRICESPLSSISRLPVCRECIAAMHPMTGTHCSVCGERLFSTSLSSLEETEVKCGLCRRIEPVFTRATAYGNYSGGLREIIHLLKYSGVRPAAKVLGSLLSQAIEKIEPQFSAGPIAVVPVPLYRSQLFLGGLFLGGISLSPLSLAPLFLGPLGQREFNHAELIARAALKLRGKSSRLHLSPDILQRKRQTQSQTGLTSHQRRENVRGAFAVPHPADVKGCEVIVVDDVFTTGATASECARVLLRAGATKVWIATVARTMKLSGQQVQLRTPQADSGIRSADDRWMGAAAGG